MHGRPRECQASSVASRCISAVMSLAPRRPRTEFNKSAPCTSTEKINSWSLWYTGIFTRCVCFYALIYDRNKIGDGNLGVNYVVAINELIILGPTRLSPHVREIRESYIHRFTKPFSFLMRNIKNKMIYGLSCFFAEEFLSHCATIVIVLILQNI